jgi:hypothetical protein
VIERASILTSMRKYLRDLATHLAYGIMTFLVTATVFLGLLTLQSLYHGDRHPLWSNSVSGVAKVGTCSRVGPVSQYGFGYWWNCKVIVSLADGRTVETRVGGSTVTPENRGREVSFLENCSGPDRRTCTYTRPGNLALAVAVRITHLLARTFAFCGLVVSGLYVLRGLLGARLSANFVRNRRQIVKNR